MRRQLGPQHRKKSQVTAEVAVLTPDDRDFMHAHFVAMSAGLIGWFVCAMFASVAYAWTFYYLLALTVAGRELITDRIAEHALRQGGAISSNTRHSIRTSAEPATV